MKSKLSRGNSHNQVYVCTYIQKRAMEKSKVKRNEKKSLQLEKAKSHAFWSAKPELSRVEARIGDNLRLIQQVMSHV